MASSAPSIPPTQVPLSTRKTPAALEAINMADTQIPKLDILLTDVVMPGLRGTELASRVRQRHPQVQVIYMSGYAEGLPETQLPRNSAFLQKPFRFATLLEQLKLIQRKG